MTMTMKSARETGTLDKNKMLRRYQNLLNLIYLQGQPCEGGGHRIPEKVFRQIQTELDFSLPKEKNKGKVEEQVKKRYRQRDTYRFWKSALDLGSIPNEVVAKEFLMTMFSKLDDTRAYGSMTHARYALETLELALDDHYGTNNCILLQYKFTTPTKKKSSKKTSTTQPLPSLADSCVPF